MWRGVALIAFLLVPAAGAELSAAVKEAPREPLQPAVVEQVTLTISVDCADWMAAGGPATPRMAGTVDIVDGPSSVQWGGSLSFYVDGTGCTPAAPIVTEKEIDVSVQTGAPGLEDLVTTLGVALPPAGAYMGDNTTVDVVIVAAYVPQLQIVVDQQIQTTDGGPVDYELTASNFGNAPTTVSLKATQADGLDVTMPSTLSLDVEETAAFTVTLAPVDVKKGWNNDQFSFALEATPAATADPQQTAPPTKVSMVLRVRGFGDGENASPGIAPVALVAVVALALRARRTRE